MEFKVRPLRQEDLKTADHIMRMAFGTFLGVPDPAKFGESTDCVETRWLADQNAAFGAEADGELVGSCFVTRWGSFGFFGPLTVRPDLWDRGIAKLLLEPTMELFNKWSVSHAGLFTFAHSPKHLGLYQKFGFWPRFLTPIMSKPVKRNDIPVGWSKISDISEREKESFLTTCRGLTSSIYEGLDLEREIMAVQNQRLGDTVLLWESKVLLGLAVCHCGPGTEAGKDTCYIKFGAVRRGPGAENLFDKLLGACEELAAMHGTTTVTAGVNSACHNAYRKMIARGYRIDFLGVTMLKPNTPSFDRPDCYVICDLR